jgi:nucleoside-diphosphate-sugar epimerase/phosphohistidine swiveling domain-containing protein
VRVLVTGASGVFGRNVARRLLRAGADVVGLARRPVPVDGVVAVEGDIRDADTVVRAARGCDRVVHLAWAFSPLKSAEATRAVNLGGTANVLRAMNEVGADHLVFASSITAYGAWPDNPALMDEDTPLRPDPKVLYAAHKAEAEAMIVGSGVPAVISRSVVVVGRSLDNYEFRFLASPVLGAPSGPSPRWQLAHEDDVGRFHAQAALGDRTGVVNVGPPDAGLTLEEMAELLGKRVVRVPMQVLRPLVALAWDRDLLELDPDTLEAFQYMPVVDTTRLREEWGFRTSYGSREALEDTAAVLSRTWYLGVRRIPKPWRLVEPPHRFRPPRPAELPHLVDPAPAGQRGSLDGYVDPAWPVWSSANVSEAFPGPMTPLSLSLALDCLGCAGASFVDLLGLTGDVALAQERYPIASFGSRLYTNVSVVRAMAAHMPGADPDDVEEQFLGTRPSAPHRDGSAGARETLVLAGRVLPKVAGLPGELRRIERLASASLLEARRSTGADLCVLEASLERLHDRLVDAWVVSTPTNMVAAGLQSLLRKRYGPVSGAPRVGEGLVSARLVNGIEELAERLRGDRRLRSRLQGLDRGDVISCSSVDSRFGAALAQLLVEVGHRGPGETELANEMYEDRPDLLLGAVLKAAERPRPTLRPSAPVRSVAGRRLERMLSAWLERRERARDAVVRLTHALRIIMREIGARAASSGSLAAADDVFYLTYDEVFDPGRHAHLVAERRAERERLAAIVMPIAFELRWEACRADADQPLLLQGLGAAPGVYEGVARVVGVEGIDGVQPGEVLVAHVTDVGWTAALGWVGAVVTDIGGLLSHAAIVAREVGVPCVVATERATTTIRTGQELRVDGSAGTVEILR